ncbi:hypothetical protein J7L68_00750, partial [bacterium]|nr:hypothetical protein [bacterium]
GNTLSLTGDATTVDLSGYLDNTDTQDLSVGAGTATTSLIQLTGSAADVTLSQGSNITLTEAGNIITIAAIGDGTGTDDQTLSEVLGQGNTSGAHDIVMSYGTSYSRYIGFDGASDAGIDMAIRGAGENFEIYEPEDGNKVHFRVVDDGGCDILQGRLNMNSHTIINVTDPSAAQDVATKAYVDGLTGGDDVVTSLIGGTNITVSSATGDVTVNVSPQGIGSALDADMVDGHHYSSNWPTTLSNIQTACTNDFHNIGGTDANTWQANTSANNGYVTAGGTNYNMVWKTDGSGNPAWRADATGISGSGNDNYLARWNGTTALQSSGAYMTDGGNLGIGTTSPVAKLDVQLPSTAAGGMTGIKSTVTGTATWSSWDRGVYGYVTQNSSRSAGVYGVSTSPTVGSGRNWGVMGYAYNGGTNIGVQGYVTTTGSDNAAILGQVGDFDETLLNGDWAGYFYGDVNITGNLTAPSSPNMWTDHTTYIAPNNASSFHIEDDGDLNMGATADITCDVLHANKVDPIVQIDGKQYVTWMAENVGLRIDVIGQAKLNDGVYKIDLSQQSKASDLWLFYNVVAENSIIPFVTPQDKAYLTARMEGSIFIVEAMNGDKDARFSFRLSGKRLDEAAKSDVEINTNPEPSENYIDLDKYDRNGNTIK